MATQKTVIKSVRVTYKNVNQKPNVLDMPVSFFKGKFIHDLCLYPMHFMWPSYPRLQLFEMVRETVTDGNTITVKETKINFQEEEQMHVNFPYWNN